MEDIPGFANPKANRQANHDDDAPFKKKSKKGGGFQSMGLSYTVLKGITKRGYKVPTPIQRKAIPIILEGKDVVAMARTGSGKTATFLIPLFEKLKLRNAKAGARALILSPTRELALQTLKFIKEIGRFMDLKAAVILGGDSMDEQFSAIHGNPDVLVATPGRFLHVCVEMDLKMNSIEYIVFDEADRLFEMGFGEQLTEIIARLPDSRQTLLFSATLPKVLVDFAKAGLSDPVLIRLDVESKLPDQLQLWYFTVRPEERVAALLVLLTNKIDKKQQTVVFAATKHHVEYLHMVLDCLGITNTYIYSNLDPSARKINAAKFSLKKVKVLIVTDIAARGIDIPELDNVINFNFPEKPKLFVHRVGRCARAGRSGTAYSLVASDEYANLLDLHLFLGRPLEITTPTKKDGVVGRIPQSLLEEQLASLSLLQSKAEFISMEKVIENAYGKYIRTRQPASTESNKKVKELPFNTCAVHPIFRSKEVLNEEFKDDFLDKMKNYRPQGTVFEICGKNNSQEYQAMKQKRAFHQSKIQTHRALKEKKDLVSFKNDEIVREKLEESSGKDIDDTFSDVLMPKRRKIDDLYKKKLKFRSDVYIPYAPADQHTEDGLSVNNFNKEASKVQFDLVGDTDETMKMSRQLKMWDRKKKKMVAVPSARAGKIKTESGVWISASYQGNRYAEWKEKSKIMQADDDNDDDEDDTSVRKDFLRGRLNTHWAKHNEKVQLKQKQSVLKSKDQILKARQLQERKQRRQNKQKRKKPGKGKGKRK